MRDQPPRKLKVLVIDDELPTSWIGFGVPDSLEIWRPEGQLAGINSWRTAISFWRSFRSGEVPDLVVADVRFAMDHTSPLSLLFRGKENNIPTGLSHLKAFAALSRGLGRPLGVGARTMDPGLWERLSTEPIHTAEDCAMGLLAAHEVGEIAAILGDDLALDAQDRHQHVEACFNWLKMASASNFAHGIQKAVIDYRKRLLGLLGTSESSSVYIHPDHVAKLRSWCQAMQNNPQPLNLQHDLGVELTYHNGSRDLISLASLFADYEDITTKPLPSSAFAFQPGLAEPWQPDDDGRPHIGSYLCRLGTMDEAYAKAAEIVKAFQVDYRLPEDERPATLAEIKRRGNYSSLTLGMVVLFQLVRIEQKKALDWEYYLENHSWDPTKLKFVSSGAGSGDSLRAALQKLIALIRKYVKAYDPDEEGFTIVELFETFPEAWIRPIGPGECNRDWLKWHFDRLEDAEVVDRRIGEDGDHRYGLRREWQQASKALVLPPMPLPKHLPPLTGQREPDRLQWLRTSLGYGNDYNSIERVMGDAFGFMQLEGGEISIDSPNGKSLAGAREGERAAVRARIGRSILAQFGEGRLPFFLTDICRTYATRYLGWPEEKWTKWLRPPRSATNR
ncbi:MAG TPA: hypothetical protein VJ302_28040 [Blastocatellia bacterium]|nr:hypothetical protein [Blastocatellia bacterium]